MSNLQKFDSILSDFDKEVGRLKSVAEVYHEFQNLALKYEEVNSK